MKPIVITLPMPDRAVSQNASYGNSKFAAIAKSRKVKAHRERAFYASRAAGLCPSVKVSGYSLAFFFKTNYFRDEGNAEGSMKSAIDGICDALGINDRNFNKVKLTTRAKDAANPRVEVTIYAKEDAA